MNAAVDGVANGQVATGGLPNISEINFTNLDAPITANINRVSYWPIRISDAGMVSLTGGAQDWVLQADGTAATLDIDFVDNVAFSGGATTTPGAILTCSRASSGTYTSADGTIKTFGNNKLFHDFVGEKVDVADIRFTKVLTKYSTEYNNIMFVFALVQELDMDRKDMIAFFQELRLFYGDDFFNKTDKLNDAEKIFADTSISKLDIRRVYRYLDKSVKRDSVASAIEEEYEVDGEEEGEDL
jgi:hypothetical protein